MNETNQYINSVQKIIVKRQSLSFVSSCVFIAPNIALTAAHSVYGQDSVECLGHVASDVIVHKNYNQKVSNYLNDIAIVIFKRQVSHFVKISEDLIGLKFFRVGFGLRNNKNNRAHFVIDLESAREKFNKFFDVSSVVGDSGGGIFNSRQELVGIHSTKEGNEIYTVNLEYYMDWITPYINKSHLPVHPSL